VNERVLQLRIGLMVLATGIIAATLIVMFGEGPEMLRAHDTVYIKVASAEGVSHKTAVRKRGILIGRVTDVELLSDGVLITTEIDKKYQICRNEVCRIYPSVIGDADVEFALPPGEGPSAEFVSDGDTLVGVVSRDPMQLIGDLQGDFAQMIRSVTATTDETRQTMAKVAELFEQNEARINSIVGKAETNMDVIQQTMRNANELLGDAELRENLRRSAAELPELMREARGTLDEVSRLTGSAEKNLDNLEQFTLALREQGPQVIEQLDDGVAKLRYALDEMHKFSQKLNRGDNTIGMLTQDRQLYDNISRTAATLEELSRALRPVVNDARVFTDKIARHPELLGVRGAMQRNVGTKGVPAYPALR
jgi:phospholipid/cholesterol/gamma-HCH transport system substrate-binding protein